MRHRKRTAKLGRTSSHRNAMLANLVSDHEQVIRNLREFVDKSDEDLHDVGTSDFLTGLMEQHEKMAWMLRAFLEDGPKS